MNDKQRNQLSCGKALLFFIVAVIVLYYLTT